MAFLKAIGGWLEGSGWTGAVTEANVVSTGTADLFLKATNVTHTRRTHQATASSLYVLLSNAYSSYRENLELQADVPSFSDWCMKKAADVPQFHYWYHMLQLELLLLAFVKSLRETNFQLYKDALSKIVPGFFALDHLNYARWVPMHLRDMYALKKVAPDVALQFTHGNFVVHKASRHFSGIPIDQAHEQNNAMVKGVVPLSV